MNNQEIENPIYVELDIDRMFKFRSYKKHFNYDAVIKRERDRLRKFNQSSNRNKRKVSK